MPTPYDPKALRPLSSLSRDAQRVPFKATPMAPGSEARALAAWVVRLEDLGSRIMENKREATV